VDPKSTAELAPTHRNGSEPDRAYDQLLSDAVSEIAESRGPIEQVKGMLMFVYRIDEQKAWELLKWRSQERTSNCVLWLCSSPQTSSASITTRTCLDDLRLIDYS